MLRTRPVIAPAVLATFASLLAPAGAGQLAPARSKAAPLAVFGLDSTPPLAIPGIAGTLEVRPLGLLPLPGTREVAGVLEDALGHRPELRQRPISYQILDPFSAGGPRLSALQRFPPAPGGGDSPRDQAGPLESEIRYPLAPTVEITLTAAPDRNTFPLRLWFKKADGTTRSLSMDFTWKSGMTWYASSFGSLERFQGMADTGNRVFWDRMVLFNPGYTGVAIGRIVIKMRYEDLPSGCKTTIPIVDYDLNTTLPRDPFGSSVSLDYAAQASRRVWAKVDDGSPWVVQIAAEDLGKSGSDGAGGDDPFGANPKYGNANNNLCSEFVSWYYHQAGVDIGQGSFRDVTLTQTLDDKFHDAGRLYYYHLGQQRWLRYGDGAVYTPRAGDFLERRGSKGAEHSMLVLSWDATKKSATVINGPWPVTLRTVMVDDLERNDGKDFRVGRIGPM